MTRPLLLLPLLVLALAGCPQAGGPGDGGTPDAGSDAGVDSGTPPPDAGGEDAGTPDAGEDAGEPLPEQVLREVLPPRGPAGGGSQVVLRGSGFLAGVSDRATEATRLTQIQFGSNPSQDFLVVDDTLIDVRVPPGVAGSVDVTLTSPRGTVVCERCYTYVEELFLQAASPREGPEAGGLEVVLTGEGFTEDLTVLFGDRRSPRVTVVSSQEVRAVLPRGVAGELVDVTVYSASGLGQLRRAFRYQPQVRLTQLSPLSAPLGEPTRVVLSGQGLAGVTAVSFGGVPATELSPQADGTLALTAPAGTTPGAVDVLLEAPGQTWTVRGGFSYVDVGGAPALYALMPRVVPAAGGEAWLVGQGLSEQVVVVVGGEKAQVLEATPTAVRVQVPERLAHMPAVVDVEVQLEGTGEALLLPQGLTYRLELLSLAPAVGPAAGGTQVSLQGRGLPADARARVGALEATGVEVADETSASLLTPAGSTGPANALWVWSEGDPENEAVLPAAFAYEAPVAVGRVHPERGAISGGTLVTVYGEGFAEEGTVVTFGTRRAKDVKVLDAHTLLCRIPTAVEPGTVDVGAERLGVRHVLPGAFSYFDPRSAVGGLSGGPLAGTLNVTVLQPLQGGQSEPVPLARVVLGVDGDTPFQAWTDGRGQLTFSDPSLVKAQVVTVSKAGYQSTTVTGVNAQNLTVFISPTGGGGAPGPPGGGVAPAIIMGRVTGFKAPRPLEQGERLEARVFVADSSMYATPPFRSPRNRQGETWVVTEDGGEFLVASLPGVRAVYAVFGISDGLTFRPHLMGLRRRIAATTDAPATGQDIVLDMHLDVTAPVALDGPVMGMGGSPAVNQLYAWLDLGAEGFVPHPLNWNTGTGISTSVSTTGETVDFPSFPQLDASNFVFLNLAFVPGGNSIYFRRPTGALAEGVVLGPLLQVPVFSAPRAFTGLSSNRVSWTTPTGPTPDIHRVSIELPTPMGPLVLWDIVLPGSETQVLLPPEAVEHLRSELRRLEKEAGVGPGELSLQATITSSRMPRFRYEQWSYESLGGSSWTSYAIAISEGFVP